MSRSRPLFLAVFAAVAAVGTLAVSGVSDFSSQLDARILKSDSKASVSVFHRAAARRSVSSGSATKRLRPRERDSIPSYNGGTYSSSVTYQKAGCGDKIILDNEVCDDGNVKNGDGCSASCAEEQGYVCYGQPSRCSITCGDGFAVSTESCDDGNLNDGDGCSSACRLEFGFTCTAGAPNVCTRLTQSSSSSSL